MVQTISWLSTGRAIETFRFYHILPPRPPEKIGENGVGKKQIVRADGDLPPHPRPPSALTTRRAERRRNHSGTGIFSKKSSNFVQESAQKCEKLGIARKRREHIAMRRAGRHSSPDPSCRPARILVGVFGDFGHEGKRGTGRKNEGAVAEESDSHRLYYFLALD